MHFKHKARAIIKKFKEENNIPEGTAPLIIVESISESLKLIESAKIEMDDCCGEVVVDKKKITIRYGFGVNRFGEIRVHPGMANIKDCNVNIRDSLKLLDIVVGGSKEPSKPKGKLAKMRAQK